MDKQEALAELIALYAGDEDVPDEAMSLAEIAEALNCSRRTAHNLMQRKVQLGEYQIGKKRLPTHDGRTLLQNVFWRVE